MNRNYYFLLEGRRSEVQLYPKWISFLNPTLVRVRSSTEVAQNNYVCISGYGYPSILDNHLVNSIADIRQNNRFDRLILVVDADESAPKEREEYVLGYYETLQTKLPTRCNLDVVVQHRCIETWLLGNSRVFKRNPQDPALRRYVQFYSVLGNDPEEMGRFGAFSTHAQFHEAYLVKMLLERGIRYSKSRTSRVGTKSYYSELRRRVNTGHIQSFGRMVDLIRKL